MMYISDRVIGVNGKFFHLHIHIQCQLDTVYLVHIMWDDTKTFSDLKKIYLLKKKRPRVEKKFENLND